MAKEKKTKTTKRTLILTQWVEKELSNIGKCLLKKQKKINTPREVGELRSELEILRELEKVAEENGELRGKLEILRKLENDFPDGIGTRFQSS